GGRGPPRRERPPAAAPPPPRHSPAGRARLEPMSQVPDAPLRITIAVCAYVLLVVWVTLRGLDTGLRRSGCAAPIRRSLLIRIGSLLATWFLAVTAAAVPGASVEASVPRALVYLVPAIVLALVLMHDGLLHTP